MKTKFFVMAAMAALFSMGFTACSNNDEDLASKQAAPARGIGFDVKTDGSLATRGVATTSSARQFASFQTWGYDAVDGGIYMGASNTAGLTVAFTDTDEDGDPDAWTYAPAQFWPLNALNFVAIAPAAPNGVSANTVAQDGTSKDITVSTTIALSGNVEDQDDIMYAEGDGVTAADHDGDVPYVFKHALSQIVFKGKLPATGTITKVTISEITLGNIGSAGTLTFDNNGDFFGGTNAYITTSTPAAFTLAASDLEGSVFEAGVSGIVAGTAFDLTTSDNATKKNAWFMLPQRSAAWVPANDGQLKAGAMVAAPSTGAYLKIAATLERNGVTVLEDDKPIYIPLAANWDRTKKYIYTIEFNGTAALTPITFSVTTQDWTDADPQPDQISM
jgi:hypothetical protein